MNNENKKLLSDLSKRFLYSMDCIKVSGYKLKQDGVIKNEATITKIKQGIQNPSRQMLDKYTELYNEISLTWLLTGEGEMLKPTNSNMKEQSIGEGVITQKFLSKKTIDTIVSSIIPIYEVTASAGIVELFDDTIQTSPIDHIFIPNIPRCDGGIFVRGDSMYPILKSGDIAVYKKIQNLQNIVWGEMYIVNYELDGDEYTVVKYVKKEDGSAKLIRLVSQNQHHQDMVIPVESIRVMAIVKACVRYCNL